MQLPEYGCQFSCERKSGNQLHKEKYHVRKVAGPSEDEITVGHWTFSKHLWHLSEQKSICSAKLSERRMRTHNCSAKPRCELSTRLYC